jgi:hypothetical protein
VLVMAVTPGSTPSLLGLQMSTQGGAEQQVHGHGMVGASQGERPQGSNHRTDMGAGDMSEIPANLMSHFKQFMASMYKQEETKEARYEVNNEQKEKGSGEKQGHTNEMSESLAQGEARAMAGTNDPYCYRCLTMGHPKEECIVPLSSGICASATHIKGMCPLLRKVNS